MTNFNHETHTSNKSLWGKHIFNFKSGALRTRSFLVRGGNRSHLYPPLLGQQTGVGPFGAKFLLRIKLTHQNKLLVALEAPGGWQPSRDQDTKPLPPKQFEAMDGWTRVKGQTV